MYNSPFSNLYLTKSLIAKAKRFNRICLLGFHTHSFDVSIVFYTITEFHIFE